MQKTLNKKKTHMLKNSYAENIELNNEEKV